MGICPLYWGHDADGRLWVASEMKSLVRVCDDVAAFPPGHVYDSATGDWSLAFAPGNGGGNGGRGNPLLIA